MQLLVLLEELQIGTATLEAVLQLDLVLDNEGLALGVDGLLELGGDGVVGGLVLDDQALVAMHAAEDVRLFNGPIADVGPLLGGTLFLFLLGVRWLPPRVPIVGELLEEAALGLELGTLMDRSVRRD